MPLRFVAGFRKEQRIEIVAVYQHFQMKVRSGRISRTADLRYNVAGADSISDRYKYLRTMTVFRHKVLTLGRLTGKLHT